MNQDPAQLPLLPALALQLTAFVSTQTLMPPMIGWYETRVPGHLSTHMRLWRGADKGWGYPMSAHWTSEQNFAYQWEDNPNQDAANTLEWRGVTPGCIPVACYPYDLDLQAWNLDGRTYPDFRKPARTPLTTTGSAPATAPPSKPRVRVRVQLAAQAQEPEVDQIPLAAWDPLPTAPSARPRVRNRILSI